MRRKTVAQWMQMSDEELAHEAILKRWHEEPENPVSARGPRFKTTTGRLRHMGGTRWEVIPANGPDYFAGFNMEEIYKIDETERVIYCTIVD
jgi:hypothetical protein